MSATPAAIDQLFALIKKIEEATGYSGATYGTRILSARAIPETRVHGLRRVQPYIDGYGQRLDEHEKAAWVRAKTIAVELERRDAEKERDKTLREIAADLEAWRAVLPDLAARASIALGEIARDLQREATTLPDDMPCTAEHIRR